MSKTKLSFIFLILMMIISACGAPAAATEPATAEPTGADAAFPVTIEHKYGSTTITEKPGRIVLVGLTEQDALLALGEVPVATREWYGERPGAIFEWAQDKLGNAAVPEVLPSVELNFEQIAALQNELRVAVHVNFDVLQMHAPRPDCVGRIVDFDPHVLGTDHPLHEAGPKRQRA